MLEPEFMLMSKDSEKMMHHKDPLVESVEKLQVEINKMLDSNEIDQRRFLEILHDSLGVISCGVGRIT